ncbi:MAG: hypothetical protein ACI9K5_003604 [Gammaproteobacteria bacterium]|jgi:hypothetical protein
MALTPCCSARNGDRLRHAQLPHPVQDSAIPRSLYFLRLSMPRTQLATEDQFVAKESVLEAALTVTARLLLPLPPPHSIHFEHCRIPRRERWLRTGHHRWSHWRNDNPGLSSTGSGVDRSCVIIRIADHARNVTFDLLDQTQPRLGIIDIPIFQNLCNDLVSSIDSDVKLPPTALTSPAVLRSCPSRWPTIERAVLSTIKSMGPDETFGFKAMSSWRLLRESVVWSGASNSNFIV